VFSCFPSSEHRRRSVTACGQRCPGRNFHIYLDAFDAGGRDDLGPWFGWFFNRLPGYPDSLNLKCQLYPQANRQRPRIELEPTDHPLAVEQLKGITFDRLLEIYALSGHDLRAALLSA
jgi:hypothetical protein